MASSPFPVVTRHFRPVIPVPGITTYGMWHEFSWHNGNVLQYGARLVPDRAPWQELFPALDAEGAALSPRPVTILEEANAILACCWRYGSYVHVLTAGESYPAFRSNPQLSRISDGEMQRINLEFSSALATWLTDRASDPMRIMRRVHAASQLLPMPWRRGQERQQEAVIREGADYLVRALSAALPVLPLSRASGKPSLRTEANWIVQQAYRDGVIEGLHRGVWNQGTEIPGFQRLYAQEVERVARRAVDRIAMILTARAVLDDDFRRVAALGGGSAWSETEETAAIDYLGLPGAEPLGTRLRELATRDPTVYASAFQAMEARSE